MAKFEKEVKVIDIDIETIKNKLEKTISVITLSLNNSHSVLLYNYVFLFSTYKR